MMKYILIIWAFVTRQHCVWLRDHKHVGGQVVLSIAKTSPFGGCVAERCQPYSIRKVRLLDGGKVDGSYVEDWAPYNVATWPSNYPRPLATPEGASHG